MIRFESVSKRYANASGYAVEKLDLHIKAGEICMLVGPSGCGKTTTMKMINKLIPRSSGRILVQGRDIDTLDSIALRLGIGYIIQDIGLFPHMTVAGNIATVPIELGWKKERIAARVDELLELVDLDPGLYRAKKPQELSGGQKQRVGVARALAADPQIMLMDEPFGALDPITRARLQDQFLDIQSRIRKTIVFVTHDIEEAIRMGDTIAVLRKGRIVQSGTPMEILAHPADPFVSELIGGRNALKMLNLITCEALMRPLPWAAPDPGAPEPVPEGLAAAWAEASRPTVRPRATAQDALSGMLGSGTPFVFVAGAEGFLQGYIALDDLLRQASRHD